MKKLVYLISPNKINQSFYTGLDRVLSFGNVAFFQLRLKNTQKRKILKIAKKISKITKKHKVKFIINDKLSLALETRSDGCHMGQSDGSIKHARIKLKKKILGVTCHNSKKLALSAIKYKANYIAFGSFYKSKLKPNAIKANLETLKWAKKTCNNKIVAIGGINKNNYKNIIKAGANYIAISSYIWKNSSKKPEIAIKDFNFH